MDLEEALLRVAERCDMKDPQTRAAWRLVCRAARRGRTKTLPRISSMAQHAIFVRNALETFVPALPPTLHNLASDALTHVAAILDGFNAEATDPDNAPPA